MLDLCQHLTADDGALRDPSWVLRDPSWVLRDPSWVLRSRLAKESR